MRGNVDDTPVERVAGLAATGRDRRFGMAVAVAALLVVAWAGLVLAIPQVRFVVYDPKTKTGLEVFLAAVSLFLALVFSLFPDDDRRDRLRWVALGFVVLGLGSVVFGYFMPFATDADAFNTAMYGSLLTRSCAALAMAVGLALPRPPRLPARRGALLIAIFLLLAGAVWLERDLLPRLVTIASLDEVVNGGRTIREGLTAWHWMLSLVPLAATIAAAAGSVVTYPGWAPAGWLSLALVLMAGAQLHTMLWPSAYSSILTTASLLRIAFTAVVAIGGFFELRRVAAERAALLAVAQVTAARQAELVRLRSDFSAMVVHELASPLAAVRRSAELLAMDSLSPAQERAVGTIEREVGLLDALVADAQASADAERDDFAVSVLPLPLGVLLADASAYAETLPGAHPFICDAAAQAVVRADPERIAQVLHNLLDNAAKYTPDGRPITLRAERAPDRVRISVEDQGAGIHGDDVPHIFEKYARGGTADHRSLPGKGLGLYLSRRIVQAHGGDLSVEDGATGGARFWFDLEVVR